MIVLVGPGVAVAVITTVGVTRTSVGVANGNLGVEVGTKGGFVGTIFFGVGVGVNVRKGVGVSCGGGDVNITLTVGCSGNGDVGAFLLPNIKKTPTTIRTTPAEIRISFDFCSIPKQGYHTSLRKTNFKNK